MDFNSIEENLINNRHILFKVTDDCSFKCKYCTHGELYNNKKNFQKSTLSFKQAKQFLDFMTTYWNNSRNNSYKTNITIGFYGGEPLLNFGLIQQIVEYSKSIELKFNQFTYSVTTNGHLLNKYMKYLVENQFKVLISLDGNRENNKYRTFVNGNSSFEIVIKNVFTLMEKYPDFFRKNVNFNTVIHNLNSIKNTYNFFQKKFDKFPYFSELDSSRINKSKQKVFNEMYKSITKELEFSDDMLDVEKQLLFNLPRGRKLINLLHFNVNSFFKTENDLRNFKEDISFIPNGSCDLLKRRIFVDTSGGIYPCERVGTDHQIGVISEKGVIINYKYIKQTYDKFLINLRYQCKTCFNKKTCPNCIFRMDVEKDGYKCKYWKSKAQYEKEIKTSVNFLRENRELYQKISEEIFLV